MGETSESTSQISHLKINVKNLTKKLCYTEERWSLVNDGWKSIGNDRLMYGLARRLTYQYTVQSVGTSKSLVGLDEQLKKPTGPRGGRE